MLQPSRSDLYSICIGRALVHPLRQGLCSVYELAGGCCIDKTSGHVQKGAFATACRHLPQYAAAGPGRIWSRLSKRNFCLCCCAG